MSPITAVAERSAVDVSNMTLQAIMKDPELLAALRVFAAKEFAEENVFFIEDVLALKETQDRHRIKELVAEYCSPEAIMEINISASERTKIVNRVDKAVEEGDMTLFDGALDEVMQLISSTVLLRFRENFGKVTRDHELDLPPGVKRIVIIGGGFVAMGVARSLDAMSRFHVTLIDTKDYWEFTPAMIHAMVDPGFAEGFRVKHTEYIRNGRVIAATATDVNNSYVTADGVQYPYDYMVIATGSSYRSQLLKGRNMTTSYRVKRINQEFNSLQEAKDVLVVGGGVVGCELASELKGAFPDKNVTIVESNSTLLKRTPPRAQQLARRALEKMGVKIIFNERILQVSADDHQSYITNKGRKITCDKVYVATGPKPVSGFLKKGFPEIVNDGDFVSVLDTLQVVGHSNIFSGGDVCSIMHEKLAMSALQHGIAIARNICRLERGLPAAPLGTHGIYDTPKYPKYLYIMLGSAGALLVYKGRYSFLAHHLARYPIIRDDKFMSMARGKRAVNFQSGLSKPPRKLKAIKQKKSKTDKTKKAKSAGGDPTADKRPAVITVDLSA